MSPPCLPSSLLQISTTFSSPVNGCLTRAFEASRSWCSPIMMCAVARSNQAKALGVLDRIYNPVVAYKKAGVCLVGLERADKIQFSPFKGPDPKHKHLMACVDRINQKAARSIRFGSTHITPPAATTRERLSPAYVSDWGQLMRVR